MKCVLHIGKAGGPHSVHLAQYISDHQAQTRRRRVRIDLPHAIALKRIQVQPELFRQGIDPGHLLAPAAGLLQRLTTKIVDLVAMNAGVRFDALNGGVVFYDVGLRRRRTTAFRRGPRRLKRFLQGIAQAGKRAELVRLRSIATAKASDHLLVRRQNERCPVEIVIEVEDLKINRAYWSRGRERTVATPGGLLRRTTRRQTHWVRQYSHRKTTNKRSALPRRPALTVVGIPAMLYLSSRQNKELRGPE